MKSAYELAMERLEQASGPSQKLSDEQKARIADIDRVYDSRAAEIKLRFQQKVPASAAEQAAFMTEMADELKGCEERRQAEKDAVWNEG